MPTHQNRRVGALGMVHSGLGYFRVWTKAQKSLSFFRLRIESSWVGSGRLLAGDGVGSAVEGLLEMELCIGGFTIFRVGAG